MLIPIGNKPKHFKQHKVLWTTLRLFYHYPIDQPLSLKPIQTPFVYIKLILSLTYHQSWSCTFPRKRWNHTTGFWNSPSFEIIDYGINETILYLGWYFARVLLRVNKSDFPGVNPIGLLCPLVRHCSLIITGYYFFSFLWGSIMDNRDRIVSFPLLLFSSFWRH